ncbi:MAG: sugar phosphate isomerase/epimerase family protein [Thermodesulfobacteriota bacterium]
MKFAFSANAFRRYSLVETIAIIAELGYDGIEIMADIPHAYPPQMTAQDVREIAAALQRHRLQVANINAFMLWAVGDTWHPSWIEADEAQRAVRIEHTRNCIRLAAELGATTISTEPGGPLGNMAPGAALELFRQGLAQIAGDAARCGVKVLIEPEPDLLIETSGQFLDFFRQLDPAVFGLNFDIGHFYCVGEDPVELVSRLRDCTAHYHLEDIAPSRKHHHLMPGEGAIDLKAVLREIGASGYDGLVTVELYPYEDRPVDVARMSLDYLRKIVGGTEE